MTKTYLRNEPEAYAAGGPFPVIESGVDWLTATCNDRERSEEFANLGYVLLQNEAHMGEKVQPWFMSGFEGLRSRGIAVGQRDDTKLIRLSGATAYAHWRRVAELSTNCSRVDLQVTIAEVPDPSALIMVHHEEALAFVSSWAKPPTVDLRLSNRSSPTLYLNRRVSDRFGRIYDKGNESGLDHYKNCVRNEWQFNNAAASRLLTDIRGFVSIAACSSAIIRSQNASRGLSPTWSDTAKRPLTGPRSRTNDSRRLKWLEVQVAPAVHGLVERGKLQSVIIALGLQEYVQAVEHGPIGPNIEKEARKCRGTE